ncbi:hypothetical protein GWI33_003216 [Rhynchophorus ferrugineus]|uniref:Nuclear pore complex protein Nup88 n=1 Tax=Rhynchophorus ferrugineus TaxID=354439 RepID=A0A834IJJ2_RHYFE|nr:hypothetical protein GWI33_003216 [Rhynchophorus ferrugineus]
MHFVQFSEDKEQRKPFHYPVVLRFVIGGRSNETVQNDRSYSLDERLLSCSDVIEVRQAKFHPGSVNDSHILALTSDNMFRLYQIDNREAINLGVYSIGEKPGGMFPGSKTAFLDMYGEIGVDFDFGFPEFSSKFTKTSNEIPQPKAVNKTVNVYSGKIHAKPITQDIPTKVEELIYPVYILRGDCAIYSMNIDLNRRIKPTLQGPYNIHGQPAIVENEACALICLKTIPQIFSVATSNGTLINSILLDIDTEEKGKNSNFTKPLASIPTKELMVFEQIELELGLSVYQENEEESKKYKCPIFLFQDESKSSRFFATHNAGIHSINISCVEELHNYVFGSEDVTPTFDIFINPSSAEYLLCTKTVNSDKANPVTGFTIYYEPTSIISLLSDGSVVTLGILTAPLASKENNILSNDDDKTSNRILSPLKKMLNEPFDEYIQKILKKSSSQPVLKLSSTLNNTPEECYDLLQTASQMLREKHIKNLTKVREELEKRMHTLCMLKQSQKAELEKMADAKEVLREKAENLAEKYEDIKDKQDELMNRCEKLLMIASRKKSEPSDAEKKFMKDLNGISQKCFSYNDSIDKLKSKVKYQQFQIENWKSEQAKKIENMSEIQCTTIKSALKESSQKINKMVREVNQYKQQFNLK